MDKFSVELATSIIHLEMQKDQILKNSNFSDSLCICRKRILNNYINVCQLFFIRFTSKIIKFMEDMDVLKTINIDDLIKWYNLEMYDKLYHKKCMSNKMILLYKILQMDSDRQFFEYFHQTFEGLLVTYAGKTTGEFKDALCDLYGDMLEWMDDHILNILSLQLECDNISDLLLVDYADIIGNAKSKDCKESVCDVCVHHDPTCPKREAEEKGHGNEEKIHLYLTNDMLNNMKWIQNYIKLITKYHKNIYNINLELDFVLFEREGFEFKQEFVEYIKDADLCFKSVSLYNWQNIKFNGMYDDVEKYLD